MWNSNSRSYSWVDYLNRAKQLINNKDYISANKYISEVCYISKLIIKNYYYYI